MYTLTICLFANSNIIIQTNIFYSTLLPIPTNADDFDEPAWEAILELAFPTWGTPAAGCPRLDALGGSLVAGYEEFPVYEEGKWNPCYYTKAFAGLDPTLGGYPSPIDTKYGKYDSNGAVYNYLRR